MSQRNNSRSFKRIAIYCGASSGTDPSYIAQAYKVGGLLATENIGIVYGGGNVGMMKAVADGALSQNGEVIGVIPRKLMELELLHPKLTQHYITETMQERKMLMIELSDAFIALPGGFGTLEELAEVTTLTQLNYHDKPVGILNINGYFDPLLLWIQHASTEGFIHPTHTDLICNAANTPELLTLLRHKSIPSIKEQLKDL